MSSNLRVSTSQKTWIKNGAGTVLMASMLFLVQVSTHDPAAFDASRLVNRTSYLANPDFPHKKMLSKDINPALHTYLVELQSPATAKRQGNNQKKTQETVHTLKQMEDVELRIHLHQSDPQFNQSASKKRFDRLTSQLRGTNAEISVSKLFKPSLQAIE